MSEPTRSSRPSTPTTAASSYSVPVPSADDSTPLAAEAQEHVSLLQRARAVTHLDRPQHTRIFVVANQLYVQSSRISCHSYASYP